MYQSFIDKAINHLDQYHQINYHLRFSALMGFLELQFDRMKDPPSHHVIFSIACLAWAEHKHHNQSSEPVLISQ